MVRCLQHCVSIIPRHSWNEVQVNMAGKVISADKAATEGKLLGESTYLAIRQAILSCSLRPESMLTEAALMEQYAVGKSTCRLALARLTHDGLVRSVPRHGYIVVPVTLKDVEEVFAAAHPRARGRAACCRQGGREGADADRSRCAGQYGVEKSRQPYRLLPRCEPGVSSDDRDGVWQ